MLTAEQVCNNPPAYLTCDHVDVFEIWRGIKSIVWAVVFSKGHSTTFRRREVILKALPGPSSYDIFSLNL